MNMQEEIKRFKTKEKDYGKALQMNAFEKKISFLNRYFIYKKIRNVNAAKVELDQELEETFVEKPLSQKNKEVKKEVVPKIKKLGKKLKLEETEPKEKTSKKNKPALLLVEDENENENEE
jgi:hypothetical protein